MDATRTFRCIKVGSPTLVAQGQQTSIILTQHDYKHHRVGAPRNSSTDPLRRLREASKAPSLSLSAWNLHEGFAEAPYRLHEASSKTRSAKASWSFLEAFVKPSRRVADSLNNDKPPSVQYNGGFLLDIVLLTQGYYLRGTHLNVMKEVLLLQPMKQQVYTRSGKSVRTWCKTEIYLSSPTTSIIVTCLEF